MKPEVLIPIIVSICAAAIALGSLVAAVVSARSARKSAATAHQALGIEKERREDELTAAVKAAQDARRANLNASLINSEYLAITNDGQCRARNVTVELEADERQGVTPRMLDNEAREIGPNSREAWKLIVHMGVARSFTVHLAWNDDDGSHEDSQLVHM